MASFSQLPSGRWRVMVRKSGVYKSGTFTTKKEAKDWAARLEAQADHIAANGFAPIRLVSHVDRRREKISSISASDKHIYVLYQRGFPSKKLLEAPPNLALTSKNKQITVWRWVFAPRRATRTHTLAMQHQTGQIHYR